MARARRKGRGYSTSGYPRSGLHARPRRFKAQDQFTNKARRCRLRLERRGHDQPRRANHQLAHDAGALMFIDAVHYAPHGSIDVRALDCDFLVCSPYKFFGPHMGSLYGKRERLLQFRPYKVRPATDALPDRWETGTQVQELIAGIGAAVD